MPFSPNSLLLGFSLGKRSWPESLAVLVNVVSGCCSSFSCPVVSSCPVVFLLTPAWPRLPAGRQTLFFVALLLSFSFPPLVFLLVVRLSSSCPLLVFSGVQLGCDGEPYTVFLALVYASCKLPLCDGQSFLGRSSWRLPWTRAI